MKLFNQTKNSRLTGFTMIELLVVATIIILLTTIGLVSFQNTSRNARNGKRRADMEAVRSSLVIYRADTGLYPTYAGTSKANFDNMIGDLYAADYFSNQTLADPKDDATYFYTYTSDGQNFTICATLESDTPSYCVENP